MKKGLKQNIGIQLLLRRYRDKFRVPENFNHYSKADFREAEKKFLKYAIRQGKVGVG